MTFYLVTGAGASTGVPPAFNHLPNARARGPFRTPFEWNIMAGYIPAGGTCAKGNRPVCYPHRDIVDAIRYVDRTGR